ncbi:hypothetical protein L1987_28555 [Smallanthus sonchifolius]|uniref:Uncharacterized protein n=1 Tax=Smallanthus sonchifolius TaxID=185202 RepID=A0ACB9HXK0_9ASTR|nr:hypothetical protein L1987_28555 [Smallanthus sonchifolius]
MQRERQNRDEPINIRDRSDGPRGFASRASMMSSIFGGRDPFDDPFFNRPFGNSDDEGELGEEGKNSEKGPLIEHPDDEDHGYLTEEVKKDVQFNGNLNRIEKTKSQIQSVRHSFKKVTYDELAGFEQEWKGNADSHIPGWNEEFNLFERAGYGSLRPFGLAIEGSGRASNDNGARSSSSGGRPKKKESIKKVSGFLSSLFWKFLPLFLFDHLSSHTTKPCFRAFKASSLSEIYLSCF